MSRTKKFLYNSLSTILLQFVTLIVGFILPKVILKNYGSDINGLVTSITQFISYFNLVEAGLASAAIYSLYKPLAEKKYKEINGIVSASKKFYLLSGYIFVSLVLGLAVIYPFLGKADFINKFDLFWLVIVLGANGVLEFFSMAKYRVLLTADQKTYVLSLASIANIVINAVVTIIFANLGFGITLVKFVALSSILVRALILYLYTKKKYKFLNYDEKPLVEALDKRWDALYLQILGAVQVGVPVILATFLTNYKTVSIYTIYYMVIGGINSILGVFINGLSASFGDIIARNENQKLKDVYQEFEYVYYDILIFVYLVALVMIIPFVSIYTSNVNDVNYVIPLLGIIFVLNGFFSNLKTPQGTLVIAAGLYKETRVQMTIQALIIIIIGGLLGFWLSNYSLVYGLCGIMVSSVLSNLYRCIEIMFFVPKYVTKLSYKKTLMRWVKLFIIAFFSIVTFSFFDFDSSNYMIWIVQSIKASFIVLIYVIVIDLLFEKEMLGRVFSRIKYILKNRIK